MLIVIFKSDSLKFYTLYQLENILGITCKWHDNLNLQYHTRKNFKEFYILKKLS